MERTDRSLLHTVRTALLSVVLFSVLPSLAFAQSGADAGSLDNAKFSSDLLSIPRTFIFVQHGQRCIQAIAADETIEYVPPSGGIPEDISLPASSFTVRGAPCGTVPEAVYQLSAEIPPNGFMFQSIQAIVGEPDKI